MIYSQLQRTFDDNTLELYGVAQFFAKVTINRGDNVHGANDDVEEVQVFHVAFVHWFKHMGWLESLDDELDAIPLVDCTRHHKDEADHRVIALDEIADVVALVELHETLIGTDPARVEVRNRVYIRVSNDIDHIGDDTDDLALLLAQGPPAEPDAMELDVPDSLPTLANTSYVVHLYKYANADFLS